MQSWPAATLPTLPGPADAVPLRLHDSSSGGPVDVHPAGRTARLYVCGITPYDATHLGHAATYLAFDTLVRLWRDRGLAVEYVQNVTDIDDPLLERATRDGEQWSDVAERETALFREDMQALRVLPPTSYVGAVEAMDEIVAFVVRLLEAGAAYRVEDDVYFSVAAAGHFGQVSGYDPAAMLELAAERGGDPQRSGKKDPLDPLLWLASRPQEPSWDSPLGPGRPGWHVECTAIALNRLGPGFDVQGGGSDLVFVSRLREQGVEAGALRLALLSGHYRADREWLPTTLHEGQERLAAWRAAISRPAGASGQQLVGELRRALADDLDTPSALALVDRWCAAPGDDRAAPGLVADAVDALLGVALR